MENTKAQATKARPPVRLQVLIFATFTIPIFLYDFIVSKNNDGLYMTLLVLHFLSLFLYGIVNLLINTRKAGNYLYISAIIIGLGFLFILLHMLLVVARSGWEMLG